MKKSAFAFAIFCAFLTACSAPKKAEVAKPADPNALPPGMMEPVSGSGASQGSYSWPSEIQSTTMPASMK